MHSTNTYRNLEVYSPPHIEPTDVLAERVRKIPLLQDYRKEASQMISDAKRRKNKTDLCQTCLLRCNLQKHGKSCCDKARDFRANILAILDIISIGPSQSSQELSTQQTAFTPTQDSTRESFWICDSCSIEADIVTLIWCGHHQICNKCIKESINYYYLPTYNCPKCSNTKPGRPDIGTTLFGQPHFPYDSGLSVINYIINAHPTSSASVRSYVERQDILVLFRSKGFIFKNGTKLELFDVINLLKAKLYSPIFDIYHYNDSILAYLIRKGDCFYVFVKRRQGWQIFDPVYTTDQQKQYYTWEQLQHILELLQACKDIPTSVLGIVNRQRCYFHIEEFGTLLCITGEHILCNLCASVA